MDSLALILTGPVESGARMPPCSPGSGMAMIARPLLLALAALAFGCSNEPPRVLENSLDGEPMAGTNQVPSFDYLVGPRDVLRVSIFRHPELSSPLYQGNSAGSPVSGAGEMHLPLVGTIQVSGHTVFEIRDQIQTRLKQYLRQPSVDVSVVEFNAHRYFVFGEVSRPGMYVMDRPTRAIEGLASAGGFTTDANRTHIALIRGELREENLVLINATDIDPAAGIWLNDSDIIFVSQRAWASVGQAARDLVPLLQLISLPIGTARDVALIADIRRN